MPSSNQQGTHGVFQWNPPKQQDFAAAQITDASFQAREDVQSAHECTGLMQRVPLNSQDAESLSRLYAIHTVKPQGNPGKDNPNNPPEEISFHRE